MARLIPSPTWAQAPPLQYHLLLISIVARAINVSVAHSDRLLHQVGCIGSVHLPAAIADKRYGAVGESQAGGGDDGHGKARPAVEKLRGGGGSFDVCTGCTPSTSPDPTDSR